MEFLRSSGVLLHISSLPSQGGIGDLGPAAHEFLAFLKQAKQHIWQVLPLSPTGYGNSPYAATSAFAGNPALISLEMLRDWGWIGGDRFAALPAASASIDFEAVEREKRPLLFEAAGNFLDHARDNPDLAGQWTEFGSFAREQAAWLDDYSLYAVLRRVFNTGAWNEWPEPLRRRDHAALAEAVTVHARECMIEKVLQFAFARQWAILKGAANANGIRMIGDVAIFVNMDSADVWVHPDIFELDEDRKPIHVAGVPPDYFSETGQRWGNPLYRWDRIAQSGFDWWIERMRRSMELYDIVRLDHFRGFEAYWSIPASEKTAVKGEWIKAPGLDLFRALESALGPVPMIAEDLGLITPEVDAMRHELGLPGMKVLQFGFDSKGAHAHLPHSYVPATVVYTGTHDNNTTQGWWDAATQTERASVEALVGQVNDRPVWPLIRAALGSVAQIAIVPAQDLLELGVEARMNMPSVAEGNWSWRAPEHGWTPELAGQFAALADVADRDNDPLGNSAAGGEGRTD